MCIWTIFTATLVQHFNQIRVQVYKTTIVDTSTLAAWRILSWSWHCCRWCCFAVVQPTVGVCSSQA